MMSAPPEFSIATDLRGMSMTPTRLKVSIGTIAEHFFPAPVSYADYRRSEPEMRRAMRQGFTPEPSFFRTSQIVSGGLKTMHTVINSLIEQGVINGFIRPIGNQSYFINSGEYFL